MKSEEKSLRLGDKTLMSLQYCAQIGDGNLQQITMFHIMKFWFKKLLLI